MKFDNDKKDQQTFQEKKKKKASEEKPRKILTAEGWKNYLKERYFSKK